jgi:hypothetical protein
MDILGAPRVLPGVTPSSSHRLDFGTYGMDPLSRPYMSRTRNMASTTSDLAEGTTKTTFHIARYGGFIPQTHHNAIARTQGECEMPRTKEENLRLYHSSNIPGYTGHKAVDEKNVRGEITTGADPKTTNGSVYRRHL